MASFITIPELKAYPLPVTDAQWAKVGDDQLSLVIQYASEHLEDYLDRELEVTTYNERHPKGTGTHRMLLGLYPVTDINSVSSYDGLNNETVHDVSDFYVEPDSGILEFLVRDKYEFTQSSVWVVNYDAGYAAVPGPVKHAAALQTVKMLQPLFRGGSQFVEVELVDEIDEQIVELLEYYKRRRIS